MSVTMTHHHHHAHHTELRSEDGDSIMTDEIEEVGLDDEESRQGKVEEEAEAAAAAAPSSSSSSAPYVSIPPSSPHAYHVHHHPVASTSTSTATHNPPVHSSNLRPAGPVCEFGERLAYTYFAKPVPTAAQLNAAHQQTPTHWLTVDDQLTYLSFFRDTGPLNVGCLYRFCLHLHELLENTNYQNKRIILFSSDEPDKKANAALLMSLYAMIVLRWSPADALHPIACLELQPFRDAGYARADFHLSCQDVIFGARKAIESRLLKLDEFNVSEYEHYEKVENGDWNYLTPNFLAFASPVEQGYEGPAPTPTSNSPKGKGPALASSPAAPVKVNRAFRNVLDHFEKNNVKIVVRLNKKLYDEKRFTDRGIEHREMYFDDGTNPTMEMCREFIDLSDRIVRAGGVVAVHCKAGLGRTGTLIGAYLIYKYGFTATEVIGYMRLMRPGTCVGPQQHFMYENQQTWLKWGAIDRYKAENPQVLVGVERPITPPTDDEGSLVPRASSLATPRAATPLIPSTVQVPGQPRKTPGAKLHHAYAAPETVDPVNDDVFLDQMHTQAAQRQRARSRSCATNRSASAGAGVRETSASPSSSLEKADEDMLPVDEILIIPLNQRKGNTPSNGGEGKLSSKKHASENEAPQTAYLATAHEVREVTPPVLVDSNGNSYLKGHTGSRIGKPRQPRPLSTITDNRQVDKIPTMTFNESILNNPTPRAALNSVPRSKGASNGLGNVVEDAGSSRTTSGSTSSSGERYNLRAGRSQAPLANHTNTAHNSASSVAGSHQSARTASAVAAQPHAGSTPSRLPRSSKGKTANVSKLGLGAHPGAPSAPVTRSASGGRKGAVGNSVAVAAVAPVTASTRLGRNMRSRRSNSGEA